MINDLNKIYLDILFESPNWNFSDEFIKKDDYKNVGIYFNQDHVISRIEERYKNQINLTQLLNSCKKFIKKFIYNEYKTIKNNNVSKVVFDKNLNLLYACSILRKNKDVFLKVNTVLNINWKDQYEVYEI